MLDESKGFEAKFLVDGKVVEEFIKSFPQGNQCYVESETGKNFSLRLYNRDQEREAKFDAWADGAPVKHVPILDPGDDWEVFGQTNSDCTQVAKFIFHAATTTDRKDVPVRDADQVGEVRIGVRAGESVATGSNYYEDLKAEVSKLPLSRKDAKKKKLTHQVGYEASVSASPPSFHSVDFTPDTKPYAAEFVFNFRSLEALRALGVISASPPLPDYSSSESELTSRSSNASSRTLIDEKSEEEAKDLKLQMVQLEKQRIEIQARLDILTRKIDAKGDSSSRSSSRSKTSRRSKHGRDDSSSDDGGSSKRARKGKE